MKKLYCLDRHNNKSVIILTEKPATNFKPGDKIVYELPGKDKKQSIAIYYNTINDNKKLTRTGEYLDHLSVADQKYFASMQKASAEKFLLFKKAFKKKYPDTIPVTARYNIFAEKFYFYFYSEERFNFVAFISEFREILGQQFFLFQVGARDMIKMSPATDNIVGCNGINLCCKSNRELPSIELEHLIAQHLEGRDIERLKGRCGKLKCSLIYEADQYIQDNKKYPKKGTTVESECGKCGFITNINVITGQMQAREDDGGVFSIDLAGIKKILSTKKPFSPKRSSSAKLTDKKVVTQKTKKPLQKKG